MKIGVDLMGSDCSPQNLFQAVVQASTDSGTTASFHVFITKTIADSLTIPENSLIKLFVVADVISMEEDPISAVKNKSDSSIVRGIKALGEGEIDAFVTAGSTGALLVSSKLYLSMIDDIKRPALLALLPTKKSSVAILDIGANLTCRAHHLVQYAMMGAAYQKFIHKIDNPKVGLLNVGIEAKKGTIEHRKAFQLLQDSAIGGFTFVGNVEGREVFDGGIDVLVTDGFTGNVLLKAAEGTADFLFDQMESLCEDERIARFRNRYHHAEYPGAVLCGVEGVVIKCHGDSSQTSLYNGVIGAMNLLKNDFVDCLTEAW